MLRQQKASVRSRSSSSSAGSNPRKKVKNCCRKFIAFMCTQVGVGGLIITYALIGAVTFQSIENNADNDTYNFVVELKKNYSSQLWEITSVLSTADPQKWTNETESVLRSYQNNISNLIKNGYSHRTANETWTFPAALMYSLSVFTMIGYGNTVPKTEWGKGITMLYATFGIPLYILYFMNMGKVLATTFKFLYTKIHEYSRDRTRELDATNEDLDPEPRKKVIVPSTACLWVMIVYILIGTFIFKYWEKWSFLDSIYYCVTSLCKIGMGDLVPGASLDENVEKNESRSKPAVNFIYMLLGMGLVAMCYNLMREEVKEKVKEINEDLNLCLEDLRVRFGKCCGNKEIYEDA